MISHSQWLCFMFITFIFIIIFIILYKLVVCSSNMDNWYLNINVCLYRVWNKVTQYNTTIKTFLYSWLILKPQFSKSWHVVQVFKFLNWFHIFNLTKCADKMMILWNISIKIYIFSMLHNMTKSLQKAASHGQTIFHSP